ncbi:MAG: S-methyl-5'-thioadenosine phosphorylase [Nitrospirae bacterium]|nr:S-methyl-5'-thioadenosine phosphorylase [Nitrospirota bacterium]
MQGADIGVIGGSGLYQMEGLEGIEEVKVDTPFGAPSDSFIIGKLMGRRVAFLSRHRRGHVIQPSDINFRANIYGMKKIGVSRIISVSAVGSMKEDIHPEEIVIPDQFYDNTRRRISTFFGEGIVAHVSLADPVCSNLAGTLYQSAVNVGAKVHRGGVYICIEGPQFSTRGESHIYKSWGVDIIGMTNVTEAKLAREAEICYSTIALVTDYDCWHKEEEAVTTDAIIAILNKNVDTSKKIIREALGMISDKSDCGCRNALRDAIITSRNGIPSEAKEKLGLIISKYIK